MNITDIKDAIEQEIVARGLFFVEISVSTENDVCLTVEAEKGSITLDDCTWISRLFEEAFDREKEDYSLTVSSAGLDQAFKVAGQYQKAIGSKVEISIKGGRKLTATLDSADENGISFSYTSLEKPEGSKKKVMVEKNETLPFSQINAVKAHIEFE
jgi:ribosome maturation factor RimP